MILPQKNVFQNIKIKLNLRTWMTLKSSVVIFQALELLQPNWPHRSLQPHWPLQPQKLYFTKKNFLILMVGSFLAPKWLILAPFSGMDHQKFKFHWNLSEAVEASWCYFFDKRLSYPKIPYLSIPEPNLTCIHIFIRQSQFISAISIRDTLYRDAAKSWNLGRQVVMQSKIFTSVSYKAPSDLPPPPFAAPLPTLIRCFTYYLSLFSKIRCSLTYLPI